MKKLKNIFILIVILSAPLPAMVGRQIFPDQNPLVTIMRDSSKQEKDKLLEVTQAIIKGAKVNAPSPDIPYLTPLMLAADLGYTDIAKKLIANGAQINATDYNNATALFHATREGHLEVVKFLLENGANVSNITKQGNNILNQALLVYGATLEKKKDPAQYKENLVKIFDLLIAKGVNVNEKGDPNNGALTPIMWAIGWRDWPIVKLLFGKGADLCIKDGYGNSILTRLPNPKTKLSTTDKNFIEWLRGAYKLQCEQEKKYEKVSSPVTVRQ